MELCIRDKEKDDRIVALCVGYSKEELENLLKNNPSYYRSTMDRFQERA